MSDERVRALLREIERELEGTGETVMDVARAYHAQRARFGSMTGTKLSVITSSEPGHGVYTLTRGMAVEAPCLRGVPDPEGRGRMIVRLPGGALIDPNGFPLEIVPPPKGSRRHTAQRIRALRERLEHASTELANVRAAWQEETGYGEEEVEDGPSDMVMAAAIGSRAPAPSQSTFPAFTPDLVEAMRLARQPSETTHRRAESGTWPTGLCGAMESVHGALRAGEPAPHHFMTSLPDKVTCATCRQIQGSPVARE